MARGKKTGGRNFSVGQSGNPDGRPRIPDDVKAIFQLSQSEFARSANKYLSMTLKELEAELSKQDATVFDIMIARVVSGAVRTGDERKLAFFLDRLVGKALVSTSRYEFKNPHAYLMHLQDTLETNS